MAFQTYTCDDLKRKYDIDITCCLSCHMEYEDGYPPNDPIIVGDRMYTDVCCKVMEALSLKGIEYTY